MKRWAPLFLVLVPAVRPAPAPSVPAQAAPDARDARPAEQVEVARVVDADTLHVTRGGRLETLRLASVDAEEKLAGRASFSASKPETLFGEECAQWARDLFDRLARERGGKARVGLVLPGGVEQRDAYGRLLCHVILPDGTDFNLMLVETGRSPYFDKYGPSELRHADFLAAEARARAARVGIWDPETNRPATPGAPAARRDYDRLIPWWRARSDAVAAFRARAAAEPGAHADAESPAALEAALATCAREPERTVEVFASVERIFDERDGGATVLFRSIDRKSAVRALFGRGALDAKLRAALEASMQDFRQSYWSIECRLARNPRRGGFALDGAAARFELAGREP